MKKIVYFFCIDPQIDPVANSVLNYLKNNYPLQNTGDFCDDYNILLNFPTSIILADA